MKYFWEYMTRWINEWMNDKLLIGGYNKWMNEGEWMCSWTKWMNAQNGKLNGCYDTGSCK